MLPCSVRHKAPQGRRLPVSIGSDSNLCLEHNEWVASINETQRSWIWSHVPTIADCFLPLIISMIYARMNLRISCISKTVERHTPDGVKVRVSSGCNPNCKLSMPMHTIAFRSSIVTEYLYTKVRTIQYSTSWFDGWHKLLICEVDESRPPQFSRDSSTLLTIFYLARVSWIGRDTKWVHVQWWIFDFFWLFWLSKNNCSKIWGLPTQLLTPRSIRGDPQVVYELHFWGGACISPPWML